MNFDLSTLGPLAASLARAGLPTLGEIIGNNIGFPASMMVRGAVAAVVAALGVDPNAPNPVATAAAAVDANPSDAVAKLQAVEDEHKAMLDAANEELRIRMADTKDARAVGVELTEKGPWWAGLAAPLLGVVITVGFMAVTLAVVLHKVDESPTAIYLVTTLGSAFFLLVSYYYGSSSGSAAKTDLLAAMRSNPTVNAQPGSHVNASTIKGGR